MREILQRLVSSAPAADTWRDLVPSTLLGEPNASCLASKLDEESSLRFQKITFAHYVRAALYLEETVEPIEEFIDWHDSPFNQVSQRLKEFPEEYEQIEQVSAAVTIPLPPLIGAGITRRKPGALGGLRKPTTSTI